MKYISNKLKFILLISFSALYLFSYMDPIFSPESDESNYSRRFLVNPEDGYPNASFESDLSSWHGWKYDYYNHPSHTAKMEIVQSSDQNGVPSDGDNFLKTTVASGELGLDIYFDYQPGDTLSYSFDYRIPTNNNINLENPAFMLRVRRQPIDQSENFISAYREESYFLTNNPYAQLIVDNNWHNINVDFSSSTSEAIGAHMYVRIIELSLTDSTYTGPRPITIYLDNFRVTKKSLDNLPPSAFSILNPQMGEVFNLDIMDSSQSISINWEESIDDDPVVYTSKLTAQVICENVKVSNGFENFETVTLDNGRSYNMPEGFVDGKYYSDWIFAQSGDDENYKYNTWITDSVSRSDSRSLRIGAINTNASSHTTTLMYRLSEVTNGYEVNKDRISPGTVVTMKGYIMTPGTNKLEGDNNACIGIISYRDAWSYSISPTIKSDFSPDVWHPFEVSVIAPENIFQPNTTTTFLAFRFNQFNDYRGVVYFDDITFSTTNPISFEQYDYHASYINRLNTIISFEMIENIFLFAKNDLSGINIERLEFNFSILSTDFQNETFASNVPLIFTVHENSLLNTLSFED